MIQPIPQQPTPEAPEAMEIFPSDILRYYLRRYLADPENFVPTDIQS